MEANTKKEILGGIGKIYEEAEDCRLEPDFFQKMNQELKLLSAYFHTSQSQSLFVAVVFALNYKGNTVDLNDLIKYFDCNPVKILEYSEDFEHLYESGILKKQKSSNHIQLAGANYQFFIHELIAQAILKNKPMPDIKPEGIANIYDLLKKLYELSDQRASEEISTMDLLLTSSCLMATNKEFLLIKKIVSLGLDNFEQYLFCYVIWNAISPNRTMGLSETVEAIYEDFEERMERMKELMFEKSSLITMDLLELDVDFHAQLPYLKLTDYSETLLQDAGINIFKKKMKNKNILSPEDIPHRELAFSESEMKQLFLLKDLLKPEKMEEMQERLSKKNLPKGITVLLHGEPGTGKTEIVKQLARETGRSLMNIDISQSKSMWFGESEKIIKRIFTEYKSFAKNCDSTPILFFNEADAILSKRMSAGAINTAQTENAIQNILLEEIENFEGILFATTNLITNLDNAFDRRFLFKIHFPKPNVIIKARIWKLKIPMLSNSECESLATQFDFSGGQIDNIVRKTEMQEILYGEQAAYFRILDFCKEETFGESRMRIGF